MTAHLQGKLTYIMRTFILAAFSLMLITISNAQEIEWENTIGGNNSDQLQSIQQTADGGYILGGYSDSDISGDKTENNIGPAFSSDYWIVKTDSIGNIQWQNTIGGDSSDFLFSIQQTTDGGYILGGYSESNISGDKTENSKGIEDYWIVKTDSLGNIQWQNTIGGNSADYLLSILQTADGGYILGGYSYSDNYGDKTEVSYGYQDYWILKTDSLGNIQWQNTIGGSDRDQLNSIQQTTDGGYILGGWSKSNISGDKTENCIGQNDLWLVKTDSLGNIQWQHTIGGADIDDIKSIKQTSDGGYILAGSSISNISGDKTENCLGGFDYWIIKTDLLGNIQWQNAIGGSSGDNIQSIQQTDDGGYIVGGWSSSNLSGDNTENSNGSNDYWTVKTDSVGNIQWQNSIGGSAGDILRSMKQTADGGYILCGYSGSNMSGDKTENCMGYSDYWIVKLTDKYNSITGKLFIDANSNNVQEGGELAVINRKITELNSGRFSFSNQNGYYGVSVLDSGNFTVMPSTIYYYNVVPATHSIYFNGIQQSDSLNDFAFQPTIIINDLKITITPLTPFRSGFDAYYNLHYENVGTTILNADIIFYLNDTNYSYVSSFPAAATVNSDSVTWNNIMLVPFQSGDITVTVHVNAGLSIGTQLNALCLINPFIGDAFQGDNYGSWKVYTVGSYDPNDILVSETTITTTQLSTQPYLDYIIRFQNTGNDTAFTVKIINPIDTNKLQLSSLEFVSSSNPVQLNWVNYNRNMEFLFDNILLPDSNTNEPLSHGFVRYRIQPKTTLIAGDSITNNAYIYFDFNAPVATNTVVTHIVIPTSIFNPQHSISDIEVFPNPAKDRITISGNALKKGSLIKIVDMMGKEVYNGMVTSQKSEISTRDFSNGIYFVQIQNPDFIETGKLIIAR